MAGQGIYKIKGDLPMESITSDSFSIEWEK